MGQSFGFAIESLKRGERVCRSGWNGKGMWLTLVPGSNITVSEGRHLAKALPCGAVVEYQPHIDMYTAQNTLVPWLASQSDVLADDWMIVE